MPARSLASTRLPAWMLTSRDTATGSPRRGGVGRAGIVSSLDQQPQRELSGAGPSGASMRWIWRGLFCAYTPLSVTQKSSSQ